MINTRRTKRVIALAVGLSLVAAACGDDEASTDDPMGSRSDQMDGDMGGMDGHDESTPVAPSAGVALTTRGAFVASVSKENEKAATCALPARSSHSSTTTSTVDASGHVPVT